EKSRAGASDAANAVQRFFTDRAVSSGDQQRELNQFESPRLSPSPLHLTASPRLSSPRLSLSPSPLRLIASPSLSSPHLSLPHSHQIVNQAVLSSPSTTARPITG